MKNLIIKTVATATLLATAAQADFTRVEVGGGVWQQTPKGYATRTDSDGALKLDGTYTSDENKATDNYVWAFVKHPIPIIPNLRLEYASITDKGQTVGKVDGTVIPGNQKAPTTIDAKQFDIIPYYNILDNTFWTTIDLGIDAKIVKSDVNVGAVSGFNGYSSSDTTVVPLIYLRGRVEIPATNIGLEANVKAITDGTNTVYDAGAKVDYTLDFIPVVQPALEVGYRVEKIKVDDGSTQVDLKYAGMYAGLMLRF